MSIIPTETSTTNDTTLVKVGIIGLGFVGGAMATSFTLKGYTDANLFIYDKFKDGGIGTFDGILAADILFLALPTLYDENKREYDKGPIHETCRLLFAHSYTGAIVIKSTVEPLTTEMLSSTYKLNFIHNPEFLTARTAFEDFHNQEHVVLGQSTTCSNSVYNLVIQFYKKNYSGAAISLCSSTESESMKSFVNCFYSVKIQFFNELYLLCQNMGCNYDIVKDLMLKNGWINPMHTNVPGPDGKLSYGGLCFPKDTNALLKFMELSGTPCEVLKATIKERNEMRDDHDNIKK